MSTSHPTPEYHCARCGRQAPSIDSSEFSEWEANPDDQGETPICPHCLTGAEVREIETDDVLTSIEARMWRDEGRG